MNELITGTVSLAGVLFVGSTVFLALGAAAVAVCAQPHHRQRLAEGAIAAVLVWLLCTAAPLPRLTLFAASGGAESAAFADAGRDRGASDRRNAGRPRGGDAELLPWSPPDVERPATSLRPREQRNNVPNARDESRGETRTASAPIVLEVFSIQNFARLLAVVYLSAASVCALWLAWAAWRLSRLVHRARRAPKWMEELYQSLPYVGRARPRLRLARNVRTAFSCGVWRPTIVVPRRLCRRRDAAMLQHVLLHELAHAQRGDAIGRAVFNAAFPLLFFHPLYWWLRSQAALAAELVADDRAAQASSPVGYVAALMDLVQRPRDPAPRLFAPLGVYSSPTQFHRRMESLLRRETPLDARCSRTWLCGVAASFVLVIGLSACLVGAQPPTTPGPTPKPRQQQPTLERNDSSETVVQGKPADGEEAKPAAAVVAPFAPGDWPQWGGDSLRNNTPEGVTLPAKWDLKTSENVKWSRPLGSWTTSTPVVAGGKVFIGTNNATGLVARFPAEQDMGCLVCLRESDGSLLWQHANEKLPQGRVFDWPMLGVCSSPCVEGERLWYVNNRGEILCLDTEGFHDGENDGPVRDEPNENRDEADIVWRLDMMRELGVRSLQKFCCSPTVYGDLLFVGTSNSLAEDHIHVTSPDAPSFLALDKHTGKVVWSDNSPGDQILDVQVSSPAVAVLGSVPQVIFCGGDGWLYSFRADRGADGKPTLLWKFDCNPKSTVWMLGGRGTRNSLLNTPVIHDGLVYVAVGQNPERGEGPGWLWCIDPTRRGDVSSELAVQASDPTQPLPRRRLQAVDETKDEAAIANPNSAVVWHFSGDDLDGDGEIEFEESLHRSVSNATIKAGLVIIPDGSGLVHCLDSKTGKLYWTYDLFAACWGTALVADDRILVGDEDGDVAVLALGKQLKLLAEINVGDAVYATPIVANNTLFVTTKSRVLAIATPAE